MQLTYMVWMLNLNVPLCDDAGRKPRLYAYTIPQGLVYFRKPETEMLRYTEVSLCDPLSSMFSTAAANRGWPSGRAGAPMHGGAMTIGR
jgi:hypothetical protein